jgi:hypothetical protein
VHDQLWQKVPVEETEELKWAGFEGSRFRRFKVSKVQGFEGSRFQSFKVSAGFKDRLTSSRDGFTQKLVDLVGIELEAISRRERSGSLLPKS